MKMICTDRFPIPRRLLLGVLLGGSMMSALAQFRVEISGVGLTQMPIAIAGFRAEGQSPVKISGVIQADLERSGRFKLVDAAGQTLDEGSRADLPLWRQRGADSLAAGSVAFANPMGDEA